MKPIDSREIIITLPFDELDTSGTNGLRNFYKSLFRRDRAMVVTPNFGEVFQVQSNDLSGPASNQVTQQYAQETDAFFIPFSQSPDVPMDFEVLVDSMEAIARKKTFQDGDRTFLDMLESPGFAALRDDKQLLSDISLKLVSPLDAFYRKTRSEFIMYGGIALKEEDGAEKPFYSTLGGRYNHLGLRLIPQQGFAVDNFDVEHALYAKFLVNASQTDTTKERREALGNAFAGTDYSVVYYPDIGHLELYMNTELPSDRFELESAVNGFVRKAETVRDVFLTSKLEEVDEPDYGKMTQALGIPFRGDDFYGYQTSQAQNGGREPVRLQSQLP